jgi:protein-tyrosine phosphatase
MGVTTDDTAPVLGFHLFQVDDAGLLFISPAIHEWHLVAERGIDVVIDLEGGLDIGVPTVPNQVVYVYFPIADGDLPDPHKLHGVVSLAAQVVAGGHRVLSHCGMGYNRSALIAGLVLVKLGMSGAEAVARLQKRRPGALFNPVFAEYLASLPAG